MNRIHQLPKHKKKEPTFFIATPSIMHYELQIPTPN